MSFAEALGLIMLFGMVAVIFIGFLFEWETFQALR